MGYSEIDKLLGVDLWTTEEWLVQNVPGMTSLELDRKKSKLSRRDYCKWINGLLDTWSRGVGK